MKKIVLIDDNRHGQRAHYGASFVDEDVYADCLQHIEKVNGETDFSFIKDVACVMVHDTLEDFDGVNFLEGSDNAKKRIEKELERLDLEGIDIPIVWFSDGHKLKWQEVTPNVVSEIKKSEFYLHLRPFLDEYRKFGKVDLGIIAFGDNYLIHYMRGLYMKIMQGLSVYAKGEPVQEYMIDKRALRLFIENADLEDNITVDSVVEEINDKVYTVKAFTEKLNNIINSIIRYGKNISSWE